ncbi:GNAT family protein [Sphaerisporangium sp. TRM90804]|uniref:GNAT family N-acetyltransferase n=1 Tax=Sphaerisporangium sp. TRM90804 TaxID=3031113 RepID=UPI00244A7B27|nr:GNAT family protein [Sphaerisporangium sp. TRM90804]MDH2425835.1 GNAT family protein [Sphaerisporangium sp. TRM90804]
MTPRTSVRLIDVADAPAIAGHLARDVKELARWEPAQPAAYYTTPGQVARVEQLLDDHRRGARWPGVIVADGEVIGQVTVSSILRGPFGKGFLGYWVAATHRNQGHMSRAVGLVLGVMVEELGLRRAEAHTRLENLASQKALRNNGFRPWGIAREHIFLDGAWRDEIFWERILGDGAPPR